MTFLLFCRNLPGKANLKNYGREELSYLEPPEIPHAVLSLLVEALDPRGEKPVYAKCLSLLEAEGHPLEQFGVPEVIEAVDHAWGHLGGHGPGGLDLGGHSDMSPGQGLSRERGVGA